MGAAFGSISDGSSTKQKLSPYCQGGIMLLRFPLGFDAIHMACLAKEVAEPLSDALIKDRVDGLAVLISSRQVSSL
ncbi:hypothetical protein [Cyanobium sp. ATX 6A2]|uniref:hypothetical protein n=1 Tax=Cyanobium sp. ATX 6A2 TaxID=2823700 RepID=UPI0020CE48AA|nr:hypothetical protein [Cyanobium sp. ATX 6A2]